MSKKSLLIIIFIVAIVILLFSNNLLNLEIVPDTETEILSIINADSSIDITLYPPSEYWFAIEFTYPDIPENGITGATYRGIYCVNAGCPSYYCCKYQAGISKTLTKDMTKWEFYGSKVSIGCGWEVWIFRNIQNHLFSSGEKLYLIIKYFYDVTPDGGVIVRFPLELKAKHPTINSYRSNVIGDSFILLQDYNWNFRLFGAEFKDFDVDFSYSPEYPQKDDFVQFNDLSTPELIKSWYWEFGDGGISNEQNPRHAYTVNSTYNCKLTGTSYGGDIKSVTKQIEIGATPPPVSNEDLSWIWILIIIGIILSIISAKYVHGKRKYIVMLIIWIIIIILIFFFYPEFITQIIETV